MIVLLDEHGKEMRSLEFADYMKRKMNTVNKRLVFIIGGPYGFSEKVYQVANEKISMSKMTFFTSDDTADLRGTDLSGDDDIEWRAVSS